MGHELNEDFRRAGNRLRDILIRDSSLRKKLHWPRYLLTEMISLKRHIIGR